MSDLVICRDKSPDHSIIESLNSFRRVSPGECGFTSSDGTPGTNGVIFKNSLRSVE